MIPKGEAVHAGFQTPPSPQPFSRKSITDPGAQGDVVSFDSTGTVEGSARGSPWIPGKEGDDGDCRAGGSQQCCNRTPQQRVNKRSEPRAGNGAIRSVDKGPKRIRGNVAGGGRKVL